MASVASFIVVCVLLPAALCDVYSSMLHAPNITKMEGFGAAVALSGDGRRLAVSSRSSPSGRVDIFQRDNAVGGFQFHSTVPLPRKEIHLFGNSLAMYDMSAVYDGLLRVLELTIEGATLPVLVLGVVALIAALARGRGVVILLAVAAGVFFVQFVLIGAGKPAEYGRFGVFPNTAFAIGTACLLTHGIAILGRAITLLATVAVVAWGAYCGGVYISNFQTDCSADNSRTALAEQLSKASEGFGVAVLADPAPYGCPPMDFSATNVMLVRAGHEWVRGLSEGRFVLIEPTDRPVSSISTGASPSTPISWANKSFLTTEKPMP